VKEVATFYPPDAQGAFDAWKTANAEALRQLTEDEIRIQIGRHLSGGTYIAVTVSDDWAGTPAVTVGGGFQILEVFRPTERSGPILMGRAHGAPIVVGSLLGDRAKPGWTTRVVAVEMPTGKSAAEGTVALVTPDDERLQAGVTLLLLDRNG
jgi:hypothetical protein